MFFARRYATIRDPVKMHGRLNFILEYFMKDQRGFNLIELMVVIAILGLLASIAWPTYQHYVAKARVANLRTFLSSYQTAMEVAFETGATTEDLDAGAFGIPAVPDKEKTDILSHYYLSTLTVTDGKITARGTTQVEDVEFTLSMDTAGGYMRWKDDGNCITKGLCAKF